MKEPKSFFFLIFGLINGLIKVMIFMFSAFVLLIVCCNLLFSSLQSFISLLNEISIHSRPPPSFFSFSFSFYLSIFVSLWQCDFCERNG